MTPTISTDTVDDVMIFSEQALAVLIQIGWKLIHVAAIILICTLIAWLLRSLIKRVVDRIVRGAKSRAKVEDTQAIESSPLAAVRLVQRTRTLGSILHNIVNTAILIVALILIVNAIDQNLLGSFALISAAIGAGLGFGAQNIVKDVLNGILIVAEDQIGIGDVVDLGLATGVVEFVSVRITHVRDVNGTLWYVRNGEITRIGNMSQGWSRVVIDLGLPADIDIDQVEKGLLGTAEELANDPLWRSRIIGAPEVWGLESVSGDTLSIRLVLRAKPSAKDDVARELRMRLRDAVHALDLELPSLETVVLTGAAGAQRVRGSNPPRTEARPVPERPSWRPRGRNLAGPLAKAPAEDARDEAVDGTAPSSDAPEFAPDGDETHPHGKGTSL